MAVGITSLLFMLYFLISTYGKSYFRFQSFKIFEEDLRKKLKKKEVEMMIERFDRVLKDKNLLEIVKQAEEITVKDIKQQENSNG